MAADEEARATNPFFSFFSLLAICFTYYRDLISISFLFFNYSLPQR